MSNRNSIHHFEEMYSKFRPINWTRKLVLKCQQNLWYIYIILRQNIWHFSAKIWLYPRIFQFCGNPKTQRGKKIIYTGSTRGVKEPLPNQKIRKNSSFQRILGCHILNTKSATTKLLRLNRKGVVFLMPQYI